jgi:ABC-type transporter Mla MlaB component
MSELQMLTSTYRGRLLVSVIGPLTRRTAQDLRTHLRRVLAEDSELPLDLDLRCCFDIDTDGLLVLDTCRRAASLRGRPLRLVQVPPLIEHVLREHNLAHLLSGSGPPPNKPTRESVSDHEAITAPPGESHHD